MSSELPPIVGSTKVGSKIPVEVIRAGKTRELDITIEELPENLSANAGEPGEQPAAKASNALNIVVAEPNAEQRSQLQLEDYGIVVESVNEGSASRAGIREGDVILLIDNKKIIDSKQFEQLVGELPTNKSIPILIQRQGNPTFLAFRLD